MTTGRSHASAWPSPARINSVTSATVWMSACGEPRRPLADRHGERGGQQPGGPLLQGLDQAGPWPRKGPELILEAAQLPADRMNLPCDVVQLIARRVPPSRGDLAQLESQRGELLDRPVMQQAGQMTAFAGTELAHHVEQHGRRGIAGAVGVDGQGSMGREAVRLRRS